MTIDSRFNLKALRRDFVTLALTVITLLWTIVKSDRFTWPLSVAILAGAILVVALVWLSRLKRVSIWNDGLELAPVLFPFARRHYRFAEFDYMLTTGDDSSRKTLLVRDYQTVVTLKASVYANFDELLQALRIPERERMTIDSSREVKSRFCWWLPLLAFAGIAFVGGGIAIPIGEYLTEGTVSPSAILLGSAVAGFFLVCLLLILTEFKRITVWQGRIDVRPVLWPFVVRHYRLSDFDGVYYVTNDTDSQFKVSTGERWYMRNGRRMLCIAENVYANYEELASATRTNYLGSMQTGPLESLRARFGKTYYNRQK